MGKIVRNGVEYGGSSNSAETIKYNETKNVKDAINEIKSKAMFIDSFDTDTGTLNTTSVSSSSNPTAASVTFDNTDTGLAAANVQDAVTEVNGKLVNIYGIKKLSVIPISVVGTIPTSSKQNVIIDISTYGFISAPNVWVKDSTMCTISIINVTNKSISVDVYNAWGGSIVANNSVLGHLMAMELTA